MRLNNNQIEKEAIKYLKTKFKDVKSSKTKNFDVYINRNRYELKASTRNLNQINFRYLRESTYNEIMKSRFFHLILVYNVGKKNIGHKIISNTKLRKMINPIPEKIYVLKLKAKVRVNGVV